MRDQKATEYDGVVSPLRDEPNALKRQCFRDGWDAAIAALPDMVQPLAWSEKGNAYYAYPFGGEVRYSIRKPIKLNSGVRGFRLFVNGGQLAEFATFSNAKTAAQADYTRRILSAFGITGEM